MQKFLPIDPKTNQLFDLVKDGVLLWYCTCNSLMLVFKFVLNSLFVHLEHFNMIR